MSDFQIFWLVALWGGVVISAATGVIFNPDFWMRRANNPKEFWIVFSILTTFSAIATFVVIVF